MVVPFKNFEATLHIKKREEKYTGSACIVDMVKNRLLALAQMSTLQRALQQTVVKGMLARRENRDDEEDLEREKHTLQSSIFLTNLQHQGPWLEKPGWRH